MTDSGILYDYSIKKKKDAYERAGVGVIVVSIRIHKTLDLIGPKNVRGQIMVFNFKEFYWG